MNTMKMIQQLQKVRKMKKEQAKQEDAAKSLNNNTLMNSKTMKLRIQKMKQNSNLKASIIETTLEYDLPTITDTMARTLQNEGIQPKNFCKDIKSLTFNRDRHSRRGSVGLDY